MIEAKNKGYLLKEFCNNTVKIDFLLKEDADVNIKLLDNNMNEINHLFCGFLFKGYNEVEIHLNEISTNSYFYRIEANSHEVTKVLYIVKYAS